MTLEEYAMSVLGGKTLRAIQDIAFTTILSTIV